MNVFSLRDRLVSDYGQYVTSFINVRDGRIQKRVDEELEAGLLWPEPLVQLSPAFEPGGHVDELVEEGLLHPECEKIFRIKSDRQDAGQQMRLHKHQADAIRAARTGESYVLTTGTGSGKSLAYIIPIVDWVLRRGPGQGIQAIVVYPMNALANSQEGELEKFLSWGYPDGRGPVTFARYTGQEDDERRAEIIENRPDILLTNYVMLELILTRPVEKKLVRGAKGLHFLVMDELHTYRGRQGADVAMLCRRVKEACESDDLQYVGTSATLASEGTLDEQRADVARVASQIFGTSVSPENVIGETLRRATPYADLTAPEFVSRLIDSVGTPQRPPTGYGSFLQDPLSAWIESTLGIEEDPSGRLVRRRPRPLTGDDGVAAQLGEATGISESEAADALSTHLLAGYNVQDPESKFPAFAFRLNQFISRGETVFATLESPEERFITTQGQKYAPGSDRQSLLLPLAFCRECGQEYYTVWLARDQITSEQFLTPRARLSDRTDKQGAEAGYYYLSDELPWPLEEREVQERIPEDWLEEHQEAIRVKRHHRKLLPRTIRVAPNGKEAGGGIDGQFVPAPLRFCLACSVTYAGHQQSDFGKLTTLGSGGRSTSTTILSLAVIRGLQADDSLPQKARKLLSFTDNRQDASLQSGHFNDFIQISLLRSGLYQAVRVAELGLQHDVLAQRVFDALDLPLELYASDPDVKFAAAEQTRKALRNVIGYRLYRDLERGWRVTSPNLEQTGLLEISYDSLAELCSEESEWVSRHPALETASPENREEVAKVLLDFMRRELAIKVDYLNNDFQEQIQQQSSQRLKSPWAIDENEQLKHATIVFPRSRRPRDFGGHVFLSARGGFGQFVGRATTFPDHPEKLTLADKEKLTQDLLEVLRVAGLVERVSETKDDVPGYQIPASALRWTSGDGTRAFRDPIRVPRPPQNGMRTNPFFVEYYRTIADDAKGLEAREHTAQVPAEIREEREQFFRNGTLPVLFCSPTMELGIDISELNVVNMRNVPPTPANYAQRSGRAGRSGQPALVFTFCTTGSSHDQYFFRRPYLMVSGQVATPRLDLANEDLIRSHIQAVWLAETDKGLGRSLAEILDVAGEEPSLELLNEFKEAFGMAQARARSLERGKRLLATIEGYVADAPWYTKEWLDRVINAAPLEFDRACGRWRSLYRAARTQFMSQTVVIQDASRSQDDKKRARQLRREAEAQMDLLTATEGPLMQSDFYSYRYFASEGFLPGYSFPRLPLSAFIPGRRGTRGSDEYLSRPRFLAISEFGPRAIVYHEGSRYQAERVILTLDETEAGEVPSLTRTAKQCAECGYLHPLSNEPGPDLCERCKEPLGGAWHNLFRLRNVSTRRRERINSDEEERSRMGFDIKTGVRFSVHDGQLSAQDAEVRLEDRTLGRLTYGRAATLWRINLGWTRTRAAKGGEDGFWLDTETGRWARSEQEEESGSDEPIGPQRERVVPYVEDHRNCLLFRPEVVADDPPTMASLMAALKRAIQIDYQLEESELAAEPLPDEEDRRLILLFEAAEGGAGVLHRLVEDPQAISRVAGRALELCHFDPNTGADLRRAPHAREDCEAACYDCLMSYSNQRDHQLLERMRIRDVLLELRAAVVEVSPVALPRAEQLQKLVNTTDSELERKWLRFIDEGSYRLPTRGNRLVETCNARPDFFYDDELTVVFIDGPVHDETQEADTAVTRCLEDMGYQVIRFRHDSDWAIVIGANPHVFGASG